MLARSQTRFHELRLRLERFTPGSPGRTLLWELVLFTLKNAWACLFGGLLLAMVLLTHRFWPAHALLARYDALFIAALLLQIALLAFRLETLREAKFILLFHVVGTVMELFKTHVGSWQYPEPNLLRIAGVPLFSGFMYAAVGSYLARATRIFDLRYTRFPRRRWTVPLALLLSFALIALFLWIAEDVATFAHIWIYPHQQHAWHAVHPDKFGSWLLLMIVSYVLIVLVHTPQQPPEAHAAAQPFSAEQAGTQPISPLSIS